MVNQVKLVSILTPSFNQGKWLEDNLRSVRNQTYEPIEHIVMDGGSTDGSVAILEQAGPHVRWRSEPDAGQSNALNKAFQESTGEIIGWINSDDAYVDQRAIESAVAAFKQFPDVGAVYGHAITIDASNRVLKYLWSPKSTDVDWTIVTPFVQPAVFLRRSVLSEPLVNEALQFVMDKDLWWRLKDTTKFRRLDLVVAADRYQSTRKTLTNAYPAELERFFRERGVPPKTPLTKLRKRLWQIAFRFRGAYRMVKLETSVQPSIDLKLGSSFHRLLRQLLIPRAW